MFKLISWHQNLLTLLYTGVCVRTHPVWVVVQDSASGGVQLLVDRSSSGWLVLPAQAMVSLIAAESHGEERVNDNT